MSVLEDECRAAGLDPKKVASIMRRLERAATDAQALGLIVFGGGWGSGDLRTTEADHRHRKLIVATIEKGSWDGGDGGHCPDEEGLTRGEGI